MLKDRILIRIANYFLKLTIKSKSSSTRISQFKDFLKAKDPLDNDLGYYMIINSLDVDDLDNEEICLLHLSIENSDSKSEVWKDLRAKVNNNIAAIEFEDRMALMIKVYKNNWQVL